MSATFLLATRNRKKAGEMRGLLKGMPVRIVSMDDFDGFPAVREDGGTFRSNAAKKAVQNSRRTILPVIAEDSGLEVKALGGLMSIAMMSIQGSRRVRLSARTPLVSR